MFYSEMYGQDIDGNRGVNNIYFDPSKVNSQTKEDILEYIYPLFMEDNLRDIMLVPLYYEAIEEYIDVEIDTSDYLQDLIEMGLSDNDYKDDLEIQEWLIELKEKQC